MSGLSSLERRIYIIQTGGFRGTTARNPGDPQPFIECLRTIFPVEGVATPVSPGDVIEFEVPDMYGRPWAHIWEQYCEAGTEQSQEEDIFSFD